MQSGIGSAELRHEVCAEGGCENFAVVEVVGCGEEGLLEGDGEVEGAVDHGAEDGAPAGFVDAEAAWCADCGWGGGVDEGGEGGGVRVRLG